MSKMELLQQADESRHLAAQTRRLTSVFTQSEHRARAEQYVEELEETAVRLEAEAAALE